jgi:glutaredoxin-related protein
MKPGPLPEDRKTPRVQRKEAEFHATIVDEVRAAVERDAIVVVGMAQNPVVKKARQGLEEAGLPFTYLEYGSYLKAWKERLAIKLWSGWPTFPQVFVRGTLVGGNHEMRKMLADGSLRDLLDQAA